MLSFVKCCQVERLILKFPNISKYCKNTVYKISNSVSKKRQINCHDVSISYLLLVNRDFKIIDHTCIFWGFLLIIVHFIDQVSEIFIYLFIKVRLYKNNIFRNCKL